MALGSRAILEFTIRRGDKDETTENAPANAAEDAEGFDLVDWCKTHKTTRKTEALLRREALDSPEALTLLTSQDLYELGLPLGQPKLIQVALSMWQPGNSKNDASPDASDRPSIDRALGDVKEPMAVRSRLLASMASGGRLTRWGLQVRRLTLHSLMVCPR